MRSGEIRTGVEYLYKYGGTTHYHVEHRGYVVEAPITIPRPWTRAGGVPGVRIQPRDMITGEDKGEPIEIVSRWVIQQWQDHDTERAKNRKDREQEIEAIENRAKKLGINITRYSLHWAISESNLIKFFDLIEANLANQEANKKS